MQKCMPQQIGPFHKIKDFSKKTQFCICCGLPIETKNIIEPFHFSDSIHSFSECGLGISLYFFFFRFAILCLIVVLVILARPLLIYNKFFSAQVSEACIKNAQRDNIEICKKYYVKTSFYDYTYTISIPFSTDSIYAYLDYAKQTTGTDELAKETLISYGLLNLICGITIFVMNIFFLIILKRIIYKERYLNCSPSDFTLFIGNLYNVIDYYDKYCILKKIIIEENEEKYKNFISFLKNKIISDKKHSKDIYDINICYKLKDFMNLEKQNKKINYQLIQIVTNSKQKELNQKNGLTGKLKVYFENYCFCCKRKGKTIKHLLKNKETNQNKLKFLLENSKILKRNNFAGGIFVTFNTIKQKEEYYNLYPHYFFEKVILLFKLIKYYLCWWCLNKKTKKFFLRKKDLKVTLSPEPEDVIWENIEYDTNFRIKRGIFTSFMTLISLLIAFILVLALTYLKEYLAETKLFAKVLVRYGLSLLITGTIAGINVLFYHYLERLTKREKQISLTNFYRSFSVKLTFYTFISSGIVPLVCNYIHDGRRNENLVDNMFVFFLCNSFVTPLLWTFNLKYYFNKIRIFLLEKEKNPDKNHNMNQKELNKLYERPSMEVPYKYSYIAKTLALSLFYISILPLGIVLSLLGFCFAYFMELYNFTHLYSRPEMINEEICLHYIEYFIINLFVFCLGRFIFMKKVFISDVWSQISLLVFGVLSFLPYNKFIKCNLCDIPNPFINKKYQQKYEDLYFSFYNDYKRQNPMTKIEGLKIFLNKLRKNGFISENVYKFAYMNIDTINVMELYYHSKKNRNLFQIQKKLGMHNNYLKNLSNDSLNINNSKISNNFKFNKPKNNFISSKHEEQLMSVIKNSICRHYSGNLEEINKRINFVNVNKSKIKEQISNNTTENKNEDLENNELNDSIAYQYNNPFILNLSQSLGNSLFLNSYRENDNLQDDSFSNGKNNQDEIEQTKDSKASTKKKNNKNFLKKKSNFDSDLPVEDKAYKHPISFPSKYVYN